MNIRIKKLNELAQIPKQAHAFDGGWDVVCTEIEQVAEDFVICKLGFALEVPERYKLTLVPRSSLTSTHWIVQNSPGLGDAHYRGEYQYRFRALPTGVFRKSNAVYKLSYPEFPYKVGDRIGQVYLEEVIPMTFKEVDYLYESERNTGGYGSTGNSPLITD
jgi:dUTP pyrophosphatase